MKFRRDNGLCLISRKVKVYDVEEKKLLFEFESLAAASKALGVNTGAYIGISKLSQDVTQIA